MQLQQHQWWKSPHHGSHWAIIIDGSVEGNSSTGRKCNLLKTSLNGSSKRFFDLLEAIDKKVLCVHPAVF